jgi:hypothetical protein
MDELVGMLILNPRGLSRIVKASSNAAPAKLNISGLGTGTGVTSGTGEWRL